MFLKLYVIFLNIVYFFIKLFPTKNKKVLFLSRQNNEPSIDFILLEKEVKKIDKSYKIKIICRKVKNNKLGYLKYFFSIFNQMYHLSTSRVCVIDGYNIPVSVLKHKKKLKVIQLWHAIATLKKFGYQTIDMNYGRSRKTAKNLKMHKNYDYMISGSKSMKKIFAETFNIEPQKIINCGTPRVDYLLNKCNGIEKEIILKYPKLNHKKVILYAPTFRKDSKISIKELIDAIDFNKYNLIVKSHPSKLQKFADSRIYTCEDFSTIDLLSVSDYVITDYSAISIEAALMNKPVYFYIYDYESYIDNNGLNINIKEEMKEYCFKNFKLLYKKLSQKKYDFELLKKFRNKYVDNQKGNSTYIIANYIVNGKWSKLYEREN